LKLVGSPDGSGGKRPNLSTINRDPNVRRDVVRAKEPINKMDSVVNISLRPDGDEMADTTFREQYQTTFLRGVKSWIGWFVCADTRRYSRK